MANRIALLMVFVLAGPASFAYIAMGPGGHTPPTPAASSHSSRAALALASPSSSSGFTSVVVDADRWSAEPMIVAGEGQHLYITSASGLTRYADNPEAAPADAGQSYIWTSDDAGATWRYAGLNVAGIDTPVRFRDTSPGIEGDLDVTGIGDVLSVDLVWKVGAALGRSQDHGATWQSQTTVTYVPSADRPWVTAGQGDDVFVTMNTPQVWKSTDGGQSFPVSVHLGGGLPGKPAYDAVADLLYVPVKNAVFALRGQDLSVASRLSLPGNPSLGDVELIAMVALQDDGTVYATYAVREANGVHVYGAKSVDHAHNWAAVWPLSAPGTTGMLPTVGAGHGTGGFAWYEAPGNVTPNQGIGSWAFRAALLGSDGAPGLAVNVTQGIAHEGVICDESATPDPKHPTTLLTYPDEPCNSARGRKLLDFTGADVTEDGSFVVVFTQTTLPGAGGAPRIVFARLG